MITSILALLSSALLLAAPATQQSTAPEGTPSLIAEPVALPGSGAGVGFDDLVFAPELKKVLVPGGRTGNLYLIDPTTHGITSVGGFSAKAEAAGGHGAGTTSAIEGRGLIFAIDRTALRLDVIDPATNRIIADTKLASGPDYVRYVEATREIWVTQPDEERIEVFTLPSSGTPAPSHAAFISVPGGPEALIIDDARGRAYTNLWKSETDALDLKKREVISRWPNGCTGSRGLALDGRRGFLFVGCAEGKAVALDAGHDGTVLSSASHGDGVDIISFNAGMSHLYLPGGRSATMAILSVSDGGTLTVLGWAKTAQGSHCVVADDHQQAWICDPRAGQLLVVRDTLK